MTLIICWYDNGYGYSMTEFNGKDIINLNEPFYDEEWYDLRNILEELVNNRIKTDGAKQIYDKYEHIIICNGTTVFKIK